MAEATLRVFRGDSNGGQTVDYRVPVAPGMVVLDALHYIQGHLAPDLAVRWNCKAGKCGSCSAEVNGRPRLTCRTRMDDLPQDQPITVLPMKSFPRIKDLVTDVSWNYRVNRKIPPSSPVREWNGKFRNWMWTASRSFASASNAFFAKTFVTYSESTTRRNSSPARVSSFEWLAWKCIRSTDATARACSKISLAWATAISRSAARRFVPRRFESPTMRSFR